MQLQIECNSLKQGSQACCVCSQLFELGQAKIILCDEQGTARGEVCPSCVHKGFDWIKQEFECSTSLRKIAYNRYRPTKLEVPVTA